MQNASRNKRRDNATSEVINESDGSCDNVKKAERESSPEDDEIIFVPNNPKTWSSKHIETWIKWASKKFNLSPPLEISRFPKDAEELIKFSKADFYIVCGSFEGGKRVSQHYKYMMQTAHESFDETLITDCEPGKWRLDLVTSFSCITQCGFIFSIHRCHWDFPNVYK